MRFECMPAYAGKRSGAIEAQGPTSICVNGLRTELATAVFLPVGFTIRSRARHWA